MIKKPVSKETLEDDFKDLTATLLKMARDMTWNNISDNCFFIISQYGTVPDFADKISANETKEPKRLAELMPELQELYDDVYEFDFFIYKSSKNKTIIEIEYTLKWPDTAPSITPSLHAKVSIPPYARGIYSSETEKFDINWQHGNLRHKLNMLGVWVRLRIFLAKCWFQKQRNK